MNRCGDDTPAGLHQYKLIDTLFAGFHSREPLASRIIEDKDNLMLGAGCCCYGFGYFLIYIIAATVIDQNLM